jgi:hypothetical protein
MNKKGFTLIQMAAIIMILGVALVVAARHFSVSNVTESVNRYSGEVNDADRELKLFLSKYRYMPNYTNVDYKGEFYDNKSFMEDNLTSTNPELYKTFLPRSFFQLMYVAPVFDENWTGDICATIPHTAPYMDNITLPEDNYSVNISYCDGALDSSGKCGTPRMTLNGMIYAIVHPGDDGEFQSRIVNDTLYVPAEGNDDLIRYLSIRDAYDLGECSFRVAHIPRQDPRYHNSGRYDSSVNPPIIRTWVTADEHLTNVFLDGRIVKGSNCVTASGSGSAYNAETLNASPNSSDIYGSYESLGGSLPYNAVRSCSSVHIEYPVNRLGEVFKSEKCCIELQNNRYSDNYSLTGLSLPQDNITITSNCKLVYNTTCAVDDGNELKGRTPYINIINPFANNLLGPVPSSGSTTANANSTSQRYILARLKITFRNGNRLYRINDQADIYRVEYW